MFFLKKKKKTKENKKEEITDEVVDQEEIIQLINESKDIIKTATGNVLIEHLNTIGNLYFKLEDIDKSIEYYELSLSENKSLGFAYTELMKLYNIKRKEAVENKKDEEVQVYLNKIDELMQLSKDVMRGRV